MKLSLDKIDARKALALVLLVPVVAIAAAVTIPTSKVTLQLTAAPPSVAPGGSSIISWASSGGERLQGQGGRAFRSH